MASRPAKPTTPANPGSDRRLPRFIVPARVVPVTGSLDELRDGVRAAWQPAVVAAAVMTVGIFAHFPERPEKAPSLAAKQRAERETPLQQAAAAPPEDPDPLQLGPAAVAPPPPPKPPPKPPSLWASSAVLLQKPRFIRLCVAWAVPYGIWVSWISVLGPNLENLGFTQVSAASPPPPRRAMKLHLRGSRDPCSAAACCSLLQPAPACSSLQMLASCLDSRARSID